MKFEKWLEETTTTANIAQPLAQGTVDVVGAGCPEGYKWNKEKKICVPISEGVESSGFYMKIRSAQNRGKAQQLAKQHGVHPSNVGYVYLDYAEDSDEFIKQAYERTKRVLQRPKISDVNKERQELILANLERVMKERGIKESISKFKEVMLNEGKPAKRILEAMKIDILVVLKKDNATGKPVNIREVQKEYESTSKKKLPKTIKAGQTWVVNFGDKEKDVWAFETFLDTIGIDYDTVED